MRSNTNSLNLTEGNPKRLMLTFAIPVFLSQLLQQLYNVCDSLIVGNFIGKEALASVSSSGSLIFLIVGFFTGTSIGAGVSISKYFGQGNMDKVSRSIHTNVVVGLISGIAVTILGTFFTPVVLTWMDTPAEIFEGSVSYFRFYFLGSLPIVMYNVFTGIMNALGDSRRPLYYLLFSSVLNVFLDLIFVGVFKWGVASAAIATTIAQSVSIIPCIWHLSRMNTPYKLSFRKLRVSRDMLHDILTYGLPTGVQNSVIGLANVLVQSNINTFGENAVAACGTYAKIEGFAFLPITCFSMALTTFIGQNLGAGKHERAKEGAKFGIITSVLMAEAIGILFCIFGGFLVSLFNDDPEVVRIGARQFLIEAPCYFLLSFSHCIAGICRGAGKAVVPMTIMLAVWCVLRIIYITVAMKLNHSLSLLLSAYPLTWCISSVIYLIYYKKSDWVHAFDRAKTKRLEGVNEEII